MSFRLAPPCNDVCAAVYSNTQCCVCAVFCIWYMGSLVPGASLGTRLVYGLVVIASSIWYNYVCVYWEWVKSVFSHLCMSESGQALYV